MLQDIYSHYYTVGSSVDHSSNNYKHPLTCTSPDYSHHYQSSLVLIQMWNRKYYIIYALCRLKLSLWALRPKWECYASRHRSVSSFYIFHFDVNTRNEAEGYADYCPRASCIQTADDIWVWFRSAVRSIHSLSGAWGSVCGQNTGFPLHSAGAGVACGLILGKWESYLSQCSLSQVSQHSVGPVLSAIREELTQKNDCGGKRSEIGNMAWRKLPVIFFLWRKRVAKKGAERPNKSLARMKFSPA